MKESLLRDRKRVLETKAPPKKRVLIVDDHVSTITLVSCIFEHLNCETLIAFDGLSAKEMLLENSYDLIILDWMMPHLNGGEALIETQNALSKSALSTPVIIYTGLSLEQISPPETDSFYIADIWTKSMNLPSLTKKSAQLLERI